jgi:hypothetical protein
MASRSSSVRQFSSPCYVFVNRHGHHISSPNAPEPPPISPSQRSKSTAGYQPTIQEMSTVQWALNEYPYVPFTPIIPEFTGPIFSDLAYSQFQLPIETNGQTHWLDDSLQVKWYRLEGTLVGLLQRASRLPQVHTGLFTPMSRMHAPPSSYGYRRPHSTEMQA